MNQKSKVILPLVLENVELPPLLKDKLNIPFVENYFHSLLKLAGIFHEVPLKSISQAIDKTNPKTLEGVKKSLSDCGVDPFMIIPKDVFDEIVNSGIASKVEGTRLWLKDDFHYFIGSLTNSTNYYLDRILRSV